MVERDKKIRDHRELEVHRMASDAAMKIFEASKSFPVEERYSLTDQVRRSSRSVAANLAEAWRRRRDEAAFVPCLNRCEAEAAETQVWQEFAVNCDYPERERGRASYANYDHILGMLINRINHPATFLLHGTEKR